MAKNNSVNQKIDGGKVILAAGSTAAGSAPLTFTEQASAMTVVEPGTMEYVKHSLQFSQFVKRRGVAMTQNVRVADTTVANTTAESASLLTAEHGANYLEIGKCEELILRGSIRKDVTDTLTIRVKYAGVTVQTVVSAATAIAANTPFELKITTTIRTIGATGTMQINSWFIIDGVTNTPDAAAEVVIDTTTAQDTTVTAQFSAASATNIFTVNQGRVLCIEPNY